MENYRIDTSDIHGVGAFSTKIFEEGTLIGLGVDIINISLVVTKLGSYVNHSENGNVSLIRNDVDEKYYLFAIKKIEENEEITLNYNTAPKIIKRI